MCTNISLKHQITSGLTELPKMPTSVFKLSSRVTAVIAMCTFVEWVLCARYCPKHLGMLTYLTLVALYSVIVAMLQMVKLGLREMTVTYPRDIHSQDFHILTGRLWKPD